LFSKLLSFGCALEANMSKQIGDINVLEADVAVAHEEKDGVWFLLKASSDHCFAELTATSHPPADTSSS
jgi:hypothetical protein